MGTAVGRAVGRDVGRAVGSGDGAGVGTRVGKSVDGDGVGTELSVGSKVGELMIIDSVTLEPKHLQTVLGSVTSIAMDSHGEFFFAGTDKSNMYLVQYDHLANGWDYPPGMWGTSNFTFSMRFTWVE